MYMWSLPRMISSNIAQLPFWRPLQIGVNLKDPIQTNQQWDILNCIRWKIMIVCEIFDWKNRCSQATLVRTTGTLSWSQRCTAHFFRACSRSHTAPGVPMMQDAPAFTPHLDVPGTFNSYYSKCFLFRIFFTYHFPWPKGQEHVHHKNHPIETLLTYFIFFERNNFPIDSSIGGFTDATAKVWFVCMFLGGQQKPALYQIPHPKMSCCRNTFRLQTHTNIT